MKAEPSPSTTTLLAAAATGDEHAWDELVDRFLPLVWATIRFHRLDPPAAEDVNQSVWLALVENLGRIREPEALPGWLRTTARNECLRALRRTYEAPVDWQALAAIPDRTTVDASVLADERVQVVGEALERLSEKCRSLLRVFAFSPDTGYAELASTLGVAIGSIGPTRSRCLEQLRRRLESTGYLVASAASST